MTNEQKHTIEHDRELSGLIVDFEHAAWKLSNFVKDEKIYFEACRQTAVLLDGIIARGRS